MNRADFLRLWFGRTVSLGGSLIGSFALPLVAVLTLGATPTEVALLRVADLAPGLLVGLLAGVWVDRLRRRPLMIWADLGRVLLLASIPAAALLGLLRIEQLYLVALLAGGLTTLFEVAYRAYLPMLVGRAELVRANSRLQASEAAVEVGSFGLAGLLVQVLTAPLALLVDAVSFLVSAVALGRIRTAEPPAAPPPELTSAWREIREGLGVVAGDPLLRALAAAKVTHEFFVYIWASMLLLFLTRDLALEPAVFGLLFALGGISSFFGALWVERLVRGWGFGRVLVLGLLVTSVSLLFVPLAGGPLALTVALVGAQQLFDAAGTIYQVNEASLIQAITPDRLLGRVSASLRFVEWGAMLGGSLVGGLLGETLGLRATLLVGALGALPAALWLVFSPVWSLRELPAAQ